MSASATTLDKIKIGLVSSGVPRILADKLLTSYLEAKRRFHAGDLRPQEVEGGRFAEAAFRILEEQAFGKYTEIGKTLTKVPELVARLGSSPSTNHDSVKVHIPRLLQGIYDIRNKRDVAHLGYLDANLQDATLVVHIMDWVLAEFIRLYHDPTPGVAENLIREIVTKDIPAIQVIDGFPKVLKEVTTPQHILILLYWRGSDGATKDELLEWILGFTRTHKSADRSRVTTAISRLETRNLVHNRGDRYQITLPGEREVEDKNLIAPL